MKEPKILYVAPLKDFSGYAHAARDYVRALDLNGCNLVTRHLKYDNGEYKNTQREDELAAKSLQGVDIVIQHTTPNETEKKDGVFNVIYFAWETDTLAKEWVDQINKMHLALVPCEENIRACRRSGVTIPIVKIPHAFDPTKYQKKHEPFSIPGAEDHFKFLTICQLSKKKGVDALLKAYFAEFGADENVMLILKVYINAIHGDGNAEKERVLDLIGKMKSIMRLGAYPKLLLVHDVLDDDGIARLYRTANSYVMPSRGEGFSITHFDAMGYGVPPIGLNWGGTCEFITPKEGWLTDYTMSPVVDMPHPLPYLYTSKENWAEPNISSLRTAMREAYSMWKVNQETGAGAWNDKRQACVEKVNEFSYDKIGKQMKDAIMHHYTMWKESHVS
jgi:glycosyltransferase involved in cell wall biosynthesis